MFFLGIEINMIGKLMISLIILVIIFKGLDKLAKTSKFQIIGKFFTHVKTKERVVALTFDDGPNPPYTEQLLNIL